LTQELQRSITTIIFSIVSLIKVSFRTQFYWNQKCANVVQTIRRKRREWTKTHTKKLFTRFECQEENHREEKEAEIQKKFRNFYKSVDESLTTRLLSAHQKLSA
jgi:hypothetical protein